MTLASEITKVQYNGDGSTTAFTISFVFYENSGIKAILLDALGVETTQTLDTDYTLTGGNGITGTLTMTTAPASGETLTIKSNIADTQDTSLPLGGALASTAIELRLDILTRLVQQKEEDFSRTIKLNETTTFSTPTVADPVTGEFLRWKSDNTIESAVISDTTGTASSVDITDTDTTKDKLVSNLIAKNWTLTTKGDLRAFDTADTRLGIGTEGQKLNPDSNATPGIAWENQHPTLAKTAAYTVLIVDQGQLLLLSSASFTVTLPAAATAGDGFLVGFKYGGDGSTQNYTIDGDSAETIDGSTTIILSEDDEYMWIICDGSNWHITSRRRSLATQSEAQTGTNNVKAMSPLRVLESIVANPQTATSSIGQGELNTSTGDMTATNTFTFVTGPGGEYGFWPTVKYSTSTALLHTLAPLLSGTVTLGTSFVQRFVLGESGSGTITARQRFVQASPPYDLGDGDVFSFIFAVINDATGLIESTYHAPDPPWANNGPTNIRPDRVDLKTGKKYKMMKSINSDKTKFMDLDFLQEAEFEVNAAFKNSDMNLIPHPFQGNDLTGKTIVLFDPMSKVVEQLEEMKNAGGDPTEILYGNYLNIGNSELKRGRPPGVMSVSVRMK